MGFSFYSAILRRASCFSFGELFLLVGKCPKLREDYPKPEMDETIKKVNCFLVWMPDRPTINLLNDLVRYIYQYPCCLIFIKK